MFSLLLKELTLYFICSYPQIFLLTEVTYARFTIYTIKKISDDETMCIIRLSGGYKEIHILASWLNFRENVYMNYINLTTMLETYFTQMYIFLVEKYYLKFLHYENTPMQYTAIFHGCKNNNFQMKKVGNYLIFAHNIDRGYTLEPPYVRRF